jgi:tRNA(fMet)-specific endonuclease VapC
MKYMLDTNICIYLIKQKPIQVLEKFRTISAGDICLSSITVAEMYYGIEKSKYQNRNRTALEKFLLPLTVVNFDFDAAIQFGKIRSLLESFGTPIGPYDLLIGAHAMSLDLALVTNNPGELSRIPDLKIENWVD